VTDAAALDATDRPDRPDIDPYFYKKS